MNADANQIGSVIARRKDRSGSGRKDGSRGMAGMGVTQVAVWCQAAQSVHGVFEQRRTVRNSAIHILVEQPNEEIELGIQGHLQSALSRRILRILSNCERTEL